MPLAKLFRTTLIVFASLTVATFIEADIEHRKSELEVQVQTVSGTPLGGATVEIEMLNHAFRFGCAVEYHLVDPGASTYDATSVENLEKYFNSITYGNIMKWTYFEARTEEQNLAIAALPKSLNAFDGSDPLRLRGHVTIWGAEYQVPERVRSSSDSAYVHEQILDHIFDYHTTFKDSQVDNFDLYNEHFHERALLIEKIVTTGITADEAAEVATWFQRAKEADPDAILFINDYNILNFWQENDSDVIAYKNFVDAVRDAGGPIEGIGLQAHMDRMITKEQMIRRFDILSAPMAPTANNPNGLPGLPLEITEFDINLSWNPTAQQQSYINDNLLEASFEHSAVEGITIWGMNDSDHWRNNALMFDDSDPSNWVVKPSGQSYINHVTQDWWEDHSGASGENGTYTTNTFKGTHKVTVTLNGETKEMTVSLKEDETLTFEFAAEAADATTYDAWVDFIEWDEAETTRDADPDEDGRTNLDEYLRGTDPLAWDLPQAGYITPDSSGNLSLRFSHRAADENVEVVINYSEDLVTWTEFAKPLPGSDGALSLLNSENGVSYYRIEVGSTGFYRVKFSEPAP